ncbi:MAG: hypothetical protein KDB35_22025, partial [Acidimicrobiales bacterium]|nr:hypothetical protein [Acidimicrobiales bacterium]
MALSNRDRVGRAFELLATGLEPFVDRRMRATHLAGDGWFEAWQRVESSGRPGFKISLGDPLVLLNVMKANWRTSFDREL